MEIIKNKGITVLEILMVIAIMIILIAVIVPNLTNFRNERTLNNTTSDIISLLNEARNNTISSYNSNNYSVHFESNRVVYFTGSVFNNNDSTNKPVTLDPIVNIPASGGINLSDGTNDVIFTRLTGDVNNYGTIIVSLTSDATKQKTITISKTGSISSN